MTKIRIGAVLKIGIATVSLAWTAVSAAASLIVGITDPTATEFDAKWDSCYAECVRKSGHSPVLLFYDDDTNRLAEAVSRIDALLVTGGADIEPSRYGAKPSPKLGKTNPPRDAFDFAVLELARQRGIPILAICRGCQALNVFFGGTLWQDLPSERGTKLHGDGSPAHDITIEAESFLAAALGGGRQKVNTYHHQAVRDVAPGFRVTARSDDGVVEAIEGISYPAVGVQFHPEIMASEKGAATYKSICRPEMVRLFERMGELVRTSSAVPADEIRASWFETDISCELGTGIAGYDGTDVAKGKLDDLKLCGLCLDDGETRGVILAFDLLFLDCDTISRYRRFAAARFGTREEAVLVTCSHTHGGPHTRAYEKARGEDDEYVLPDDPDHPDVKYVKWLDAAVESAIARAAANPEWHVCRVGYFSSSCDENRNRRYTTPDNCASFIAHRRTLHGISTGIADKELGTVVLLDAKTTEPLYVIGNYAAHPLASHAPGAGGLRITADYPGVYRRYIRSESGAHAMFVQGAAGDLVPKDDELGVAAARRTGENLAMASLAAVIDIQRNAARFVMKKPRIGAALRRFESPVRKVWRPVLKKDRMTLEIQVLSVGDVAFVGLPGEPVNELGLEIKWHSPFRRTFIAYGATGNCGYVSPENFVAAGAYEPQYQEFFSRDTLKLVETARNALFETREKVFPEDGVGVDGYPDNLNLPLVNLPGGVKASKWQK